MTETTGRRARRAAAVSSRLARTAAPDAPRCTACGANYIEEDPFYAGSECWRCRCATRQETNVTGLARVVRREPPTRKKITP